MVEASLSCSLLVEGQNVSCVVFEEDEVRETLTLGSFLPSSSEESRQTIGRLSSEESDIGEPSLAALLPAFVLSKPFHAKSFFSSTGSTLGSTDEQNEQLIYKNPNLSIISSKLPSYKKMKFYTFR